MNEDPPAGTPDVTCPPVTLQAPSRDEETVTAKHNLGSNENAMIGYRRCTLGVQNRRHYKQSTRINLAQPFIPVTGTHITIGSAKNPTSLQESLNRNYTTPENITMSFKTKKMRPKRKRSN